MTPEKKVKNAVVKRLKEMTGVYYFYPVTSGYGRSGVPDIVGCYKGKFFGIECKAGKNKLRRYRFSCERGQHGYIYFVVHVGVKP